VNACANTRAKKPSMNTIGIQPALKGQVSATSSDGHSFLTTTPLLDGARYWLEKGISPDTSLITVWSSGSSHWTLRSTIGQAGKLTVKSDNLGKPSSNAIKIAGKVSPHARTVRKITSP
jgi:hypothetical protein